MDIDPGTCQFCGHQPVARDAPKCPACGRLVPNPGSGTQLRNAFLWVVILVGGVLAAYFLWRRFG